MVMPGLQKMLHTLPELCTFHFQVCLYSSSALHIEDTRTPVRTGLQFIWSKAQFKIFLVCPFKNILQQPLAPSGLHAQAHFFFLLPCYIFSLQKCTYIFNLGLKWVEKLVSTEFPIIPAIPPKIIRKEKMPMKKKKKSPNKAALYNSVYYFWLYTKSLRKKILST